MKKMSIGICICITFMLCVSCAPNIKREMGSLNLKYQYNEPQMKKVGLTIALVSPHFKAKGNTGSEQMMQMAAARSGQMGMLDFNARFYGSESNQDYVGTVVKSLERSFQEILTKKGFNFTGPFPTFDDMTYNEKKKGYLALIPVFDMNIQGMPTESSKCDPLSPVCTNSGMVKVGGEFNLVFIEPMTKEKIMTKRINLSDFGIEVPYRVDVKNQSQGTNTRIISSILSSNKQFQDTTDKALTDALNEFYKKSLEKIVKFLSTEEIVNYQAQIQELKDLKRF